MPQFNPSPEELELIAKSMTVCLTALVHRYGNPIVITQQDFEQALELGKYLVIQSDPLTGERHIRIANDPTKPHPSFPQVARGHVEDEPCSCKLCTLRREGKLPEGMSEFLDAIDELSKIVKKYPLN